MRLEGCSLSKHSFRLSSDAEAIRKRIFDKNGLVSEKLTENWETFFIDIAPKLLLDNSSPAPLSPSGEQSPTVETETAPETESPLDFASEHPCPYRTLVNVKGNAAETHILCSETDKLPLAACITRQKRYLHFERSCRPLKQDKEKPAKPQREQIRTRAFKGNDFVQEGVLPRFFCPDGHPPSWCHGGNSCNRRLTCPEMNRQPSR
jgi:hypothetical protein